MRVRHPDPLVRRSLGCFLREPLWAMAIVLAVAAFALARATPPLVDDASADRSFAAEVDTSATSAGIGLGLNARAYTTGLADLPAVQAVSALLDPLPVYGPPVVSVSPLAPYNGHDHPTPVLRTLDGRQATAVVFSIGDAIASLRPAAPPGRGGATGAGIWLPDALAAGLDLAVGDRVVLALDYPSFAPPPDRLVDAPTVVAGIYVTVDGLPASQVFAWRSPPAALPWNPAGGVGTPPLLLADAATAMSLIAAMGDKPMVTWDLPWSGPVSIERGREAAAALKQTAAGLLDTDSPVGHQVAVAHGQRVVLSSGVPSFVQRSQEAAAALQPVVDSIAFTAQFMCLLVLAICIWMLCRVRRREHALSLAMGATPVRASALVTLEQLVPVALGTGAAYVVVRWFSGVVAGGGSIAHDTLSQAGHRVLWAVPIGTVVVALSGFAAVWPMDAASEGRARRVAGALRAETIVVVGAVLSGAQLATQKGSALDSGTSLLFPFLAVLAGSVLVVRGAAMLARRIGSRRIRPTTDAPPGSLALWLARRRLSYSLTELSALVVVVASGVGLFVYCASISADGQRGVRDKAAAIGGAAATAKIGSTQDVPHDADGFPADLPAGTTVVWTTTDARMAPNAVADILAVDPDTFDAAAAWRSSFAGPSLASLLSGIDGTDPTVLAVVVAGNYNATFPDRGSMQLDFGAREMRYRVVARIAAAPWQREHQSVAIVSARALASLLPPVRASSPVKVLAARLDQNLRTYVWSSATQPELEAALGPAARAAAAPNVPGAERLPSFVAFDLSLPYLRLVGAALLLVSLASIVVLGARRRTELAVEVALTDLMGIRRRTVAGAVAGSAVLLGVVAALIGTVLAGLLTGFMIRQLDPAPGFPPSFSGSLSPAAVLAAVAGVVAVSLAGASFELHRARRANVAEVLRGAD